MTSPEAPTGDRALSTPTSKALIQQMHDTLRQEGVPRKFAEQNLRRLRYHKYSDTELQWMIRQIEKQVAKFLTGA